MTLGRPLATLAILTLCAACGGGASDPKSLCGEMFDQRLKIFRVDDPQSKRQMFIDACVELDVEYLKCAASESTSEACTNQLEGHMEEQDGLNTMLMTGKKPGQAEAERAAAQEVENETIAKRQAERGKDMCSQICGKQRDVGFDPDEPDTIKKETQCKAHCAELVDAGGDAKSFVDEINGCMKQEGMAGFYTCIGETNTRWRSRGIADPPQW